MKKIVAVSIAVALLAATIPSKASADGGWAMTGKILTGIIGLNILGHVIAESARPYPAYYGPPPAYGPDAVWVPGHYEVRIERRWRPGHWEIAGGAGYDDDGYRERPRREWIPGHYRDIEVSVWIPGHWEG